MQKIVAREFLLLLIVILITALTFAGTFGYNRYLSFHKNNLEDSITKTQFLIQSNIDELKNNYINKIDKQTIIFNCAQRIYSNVGYAQEYETRYQYWSLFSTRDYETFMKEYTFNSFYKVYNSKCSWVDQIYNFDQYQSFVKDNTITEKDDNDYKSGISNENHRANILNRIKIINTQMVTEKEKKDVSLKVLFFLLIILFGFRFLFYSIRWSLKTLKS